MSGSGTGWKMRTLVIFKRSSFVACFPCATDTELLSTKLGVSQKMGVSLQTFTKIHQIRGSFLRNTSTQIGSNWFHRSSPYMADELALPWGINPCSVLPHGMCLRRLSITRTTLVETLRLLEVVELVDWLIRWVWLGSQQGKLLVDCLKETGGWFIFVQWNVTNGACVVSPSDWFFECYHLISMRVKVYSHPLSPQTSTCCWAIPQFWWTATRALLWFQYLEDFNPMTEDVEVRIAPLGKHVPSRKKKTQHVPRRRNLPTRCVNCVKTPRAKKSSQFRPALRWHTSIVWPVKLQPLGGFWKVSEKTATGRWSHWSSLSWTII